MIQSAFIPRFITLIFGVTTLMISNLLAQNQELRDPVLMHVKYDFFHIDDSTQRDRPIQDELILYVGKKSTLFRRAASENYASADAKRLGKESNLEDVIDDYAGLIHDFSNQSMQSHEKILESHFIIDFKIPEIDWKIEGEEKEILDWTVQKAIGEYAGRTYTAWFAKDLPISAGPYVFSGLPGLILEISDQKNEVSYVVTEFLTLQDSIFNIRYPNGHRKVSQHEFQKIQRLWREDPKSFIKAQGLTNVFVGTAVGKSAKKFNNPIEKL